MASGTNRLLSADVTIEDIILMLPVKERAVVVRMREEFQQERNRNLELESQLRNVNQRIADLETQLSQEKSQKELQTAIAGAGGPNTSAHTLLHNTFQILRAHHNNAVDSVRRRTAEAIQTMDDTQYDAASALKTSVNRTLRPTPKTFELVDLLQMKQNLVGEGHAPQSANLFQFVREFTDHIDAVRQCSKDSQHAFIHNDAIRANLLRKVFDLCKTVEAKLGTGASHLNLPAPQLASMEIIGRDNVEHSVRNREFQNHLNAMSSCGEVFNQCGRDIDMIEDLVVSAKNIPNFLPEFDAIAQQLAVDAEILQRNEVILVEAGSLHIESFNAQRQTFVDECATKVDSIRAHQVAIDSLYDEMVKLLTKVEEEYTAIHDIEVAHCKIQVDIARAEHRVVSVRKAVESEVQKQRRFQEGAKFSTFLCTQGKDLFRKLHSASEDALRQRKDFVDRVKISSQEQLYTVAEVLHDVLTKRIQADNHRMRNDHQALEAGNRALMGLVHSPPEMEKQMTHIRELTSNVGAAKQRIAATNAEIAQVRSVLLKYGTTLFLKRDNNFLAIHEGQERLTKTREKIEDGVQRLKYVAEILVEVSDPDTRQDFVVAQCLDALKVSVSDMSDLVAQRHLISECDEMFRNSALSKMKRHYSLITHFLHQMHDNVSDIQSADPSIETNVAALVHLMDQIKQSLQGEVDEVSRMRLRQNPGGLLHGGASPLQHQSLGNPGGSSSSQQRGTSMLGAESPHLAALAGAVTQQQQQQHHHHHDPQQAASSAAAVGQVQGAAGAGHLFAEPVREIINEHHAFARASAKLKISADQRRLIKPPGGIELSNTSALGSVGFRYGSGVHSFCVKVGPNCSRLLVGVADWNLPLDGYCNSLKYSGCYYLHIGAGTLWAPDMKFERKPYTHHAIGSMVGTILRCIVDTENCCISFAVCDPQNTSGGLNLGVAFKNINLSRTLYPSFELFSGGCECEFVDDPRLAAQTSASGGGQYQ